MTQKGLVKYGLHRREFLKSATGFGASFLIPGGLLGQADGGPLPSTGRVNLALVGVGHRGTENYHVLMQTGLCNIVALCDVDLQGEQCLEVLQAHPDVPRFTDFRRMFDKMAREIDAVLVSTPDHSHFSVTMLAMSLGKHVYVEKPLAQTFGQCERMIDLARRSGVVTQMGNQGHSGPNYFQFKAWAEAGLIKDVERITAFMNNSRRWHGWGRTVTRYPSDPMPEGIDWETWMDGAPEHPYSEKLHHGNWRSWFDYGSGAFGDWGPHIIDTTHRFLNLGLPERITALSRDGANPLVYPQASTIQFDFPKREGMPPCRITWYEGVNNKPQLEREYWTTMKDEASGREWLESPDLGRPGKIIYGKEHVFKGGSHADVLQMLPREKHLDMRRSFPQFSQRNSNHYENFFLACMGREEVRSPFSVSGPLTQGFNLGCIAQRLGDTLQFDRQLKAITNNPLANALLDPPPRRGWEEFYRL